MHEKLLPVYTYIAYRVFYFTPPPLLNFRMIAYEYPLEVHYKTENDIFGQNENLEPQPKMSGSVLR